MYNNKYFYCSWSNLSSYLSILNRNLTNDLSETWNVKIKRITEIYVGLFFNKYIKLMGGGAE